MCAHGSKATGCCLQTLLCLRWRVQRATHGLWEEEGGRRLLAAGRGWQGRAVRVLGVPAPAGSEDGVRCIAQRAGAVLHAAQALQELQGGLHGGTPPQPLLPPPCGCVPCDAGSWWVSGTNHPAYTPPSRPSTTPAGLSSGRSPSWSDCSARSCSCCSLPPSSAAPRLRAGRGGAAVLRSRRVHEYCTSTQAH